MKKRIVALLLLACMLFAFSAETFAATVRVKSVKITGGNVSILVGDSITLKATVTPSNATNKGVTWSTSNKAIATVSSTGVVKGLKAGKVTITATSKDNKKIKATCEIEVASVPVKGLEIVNGNAKISVGESITLKTTVTPSNATNKGVTWSTSNKAVATVSSSGVVKGLKTGTVTITATSKDNKKISRSCIIEIVLPYVPVNSLRITNGGYISLLRGEKITLKTAVAPSNATNKDVTWSSSNPLVAKVSSSGVVTSANDLPGFDGYATITATSKDNKKIVAFCTVFVGDGYVYRVVKVRDIPRRMADKPIDRVWGEPKHKLSIKRSKEWTRSYSVSAKVSIKEIGTEIGWGADAKDTVKIESGDEWTVPEKVGKKKVKKASLDVYVYLDRVEYKIQRRAWRVDIPVRYGKWEDWKTGCIAEKTCEDEFEFKNTYVYK